MDRDLMWNASGVDGPRGPERFRDRRVAAVLVAGLVFLAGCEGASPTAPTPTPATSQFSEASFREASRITAVAAAEVLATARVGQYEGDIKTVIDLAFVREGAGPPAFPHIVASGPNALELHYAGGDRQLTDGDLLVVDIGATSNQHCSDFSRTLPASGRFTARQRELYQLVLDVQRQVEATATTMVVSLATLDAQARNLFRASPLQARDSAGSMVGMDKFFIHTLGHYVGRQVHGQDTGWMKNEPIRLGQVLTLEPGLYIASEGIGIRIEDTYLFTMRGLECLTCAAPKEVWQLEK